MSYKEKLNASQASAHNQNIATKILRDLSTLRSTIDENTSNARRWIWELVQNAKDVSQAEGVKIRVAKSSSNEFIFSHNGKPFKADNIRFLIEQISTKDQEKEDETGKRKTTGKFGTGFLTTHLLSERVTVHGVLKDKTLPYKRFEVMLDRSGYSNREIIESVEKSRAVLNEVDHLPNFEAYDASKYNTQFIYPLLDDVAERVYSEGLNDLKSNIGYTLALNDEIKEVAFGSKGRIYKLEKTTPLSDIGQVITVKKEYYEGDAKELHYAILSENFTSIIIPIEVEKGSIRILPIEDNVPSLFCQFPLLGSDSFRFPAVINNPNFNPTEPRDGIHLTTPARVNPSSEQNKEYISEAIGLFQKLVRLAINDEWKNLHLLAKVETSNEYQNWLNQNYYESKVVGEVRRIIMRKSILTSSVGHLIPLFDKKDLPYALIPTIPNYKIRDEAWNIGISLFGDRLPKLDHVPFWSKYAWDICGKFNLATLCNFIEKSQRIEELQGALGHKDAISWLNLFYKLLEKDEYNYDKLINKYQLFPNQNGYFIKMQEIQLEDDTINELFKDILRELGSDVRKNLINNAIEFNFEEVNSINEPKVTRMINVLALEKANDREQSKNYRTAFNLILKFFRDDEKEARVKFPSLHQIKYLLYDEEEMIENVEKIEKLNDLLQEFDLADISEIKSILSKMAVQKTNTEKLLPITSEILSSLGVTNIEEWREAMQDQNLADMFDHSSVPTADMFVKAATYIERAKTAIFEHLKELQDYDLSEADFTADTILGGVKKNSSAIDIVCRPAYKDEVIVYYQAERDVLDYQDSELWVDTNKEVKRISLGHILKSAQIHKFPI
ncbi:hypothetical protein CLV84_0821 [Neolewinella xylanilytica]|uniref:Uncharacterized protein n=1 Tax=Neolewinella xylanilytica TaxID=1514080 RepID=A0A2S6I8N4_9BACT|nr:hypothetical protein [Neolewinella xylanilytica]PPK87867.1 hypothetical protein CLV84_0821 [Neolewinella xylanilytica]